MLAYGCESMENRDNSKEYSIFARIYRVDLFIVPLLF
ncbi:hypothetical protein SAMN05444266_107430 [Chitinophaga jiangningensis]|uniref:Uncharacterized protein n=1 Tax=Chitinophaga jiangningensis TaxID=1419482 RepID=A0A1M7HY74_9BACT|nr:hypothetical protein SAMN05444266_107430 [Chitinophaga jiangningensis]